MSLGSKICRTPLHMAVFFFLFLLLSTAVQSYAEIIFSDNFEQFVDPQKWQSITADPSPRSSVSTDNRPENVHSGLVALKLTAGARHDSTASAQVTTWFMPGYDKLYYRYYAKFASDFDQGNLMHWTFIGGNNIYSEISAMGKAGIKPSGQDFFTTGFEPWRDWGRYPPPGALNFYTNYPDMTAAPGGFYWGNQFQPMVPFVVERGRWYCYEFMVKLNKPGEHDGEQAFWIDGVKIFHQRNIRWRDSEILKLNFFWFSVYIHESRQDNTCWYDDLVISTDYVGPLEGIKPGTPQDYDLNLDGKCDQADVLLMLRMKRDDPEDGRADYNRDGKSTITDVIQLLIDSGKSQISQLLSKILPH